MVRELYFLLIYESTWFTMPSMSTHDSIARIRQPVTFLPRKYSTFALFSFLLRKMIESTAVECNTLIKVGTRSLSQSVSQSVSQTCCFTLGPSLPSFFSSLSQQPPPRAKAALYRRKRATVRPSLTVSHHRDVSRRKLCYSTPVVVRPSFKLCG